MEQATQDQKIPFFQDGIQYYYESRGCAVEVFDCNYERIAMGDYHTSFEDVSFEYYDETGEIIGEGSNAYLFNYTYASLARWLAATHPGV